MNVNNNNNTDVTKHDLDPVHCSGLLQCIILADYHSHFTHLDLLLTFQLLYCSALLQCIIEDDYHSVEKQKLGFSQAYQVLAVV